MSEAKPTSASVGAQRVKLASSLEWKNLLTHFDLTDGEGFAFIVLLVADAEWAEACRLALERYLLIRKKMLCVVSFQDAGEFKDELASRLLSLETAPDTGAVWMAATVMETDRDYESWAAAWRTGVARLNQYRNPLIRHFDVPLIFVGAPWIQTVLREMSPDLWSVRALVVRIESLVSKTISTGDASASAGTISSGTIDAEGRAIDPEFALREAARLRGRTGSELTLARLLRRAGTGFNARSRWAEGAEALREAVELYRRLPDSKADLAASLFNLSTSYLWQTDYSQATANLTEAQTLYREVGDVLGEANCIKRLGNIALQRSDHATATQHYEQALALFREVGSVLGEANCISSLGNIALERSDHATATQHYEQALSLYREVGSLQGEANCISSLGDIASKLGNTKEAIKLWTTALDLYELMAEPYSIGEAHRRLARIAASDTERGQHIEAARLAWQSIDRPDLIAELEKEFAAQK
ncbi:MAG: tetratricopeptide repeat protein [Acidobacteriota bacterium]|nr:tetratricopeptide repeat protein [Acidobacteriota bacterium]